ncbi:MAG: RpiB/LacA/LacB family sugar-phosphate isomerase [Anaerolineaceae bacterium]|nr:MAG: RpiB/LacA/LacB family sugar-phosphate isomerase [Anaerolineaceae bacterium]
MKIAMGADFNAHGIKDAVKKFLEEKGHEVLDYSGSSEEKRLFLDIVPQVAKSIQAGECKQGILFCGTGMGMSLLANKYKGIYAACCESVFSAKKCRVINNANVLTMGAWIIGDKMACDMAEVFIESQMGEGLEDWRKKNVTLFYEKTKIIEDENFK